MGREQAAGLLRGLGDAMAAAARKLGGTMPTGTTRSTRFLLEHFSPKQIRSIAAANRWINVWEGAVSSGKTIASAWAWLLFVPQASTAGELVMIGKTRDAMYRNVLQPMMNPQIFGELAAQIDYAPGAPTCRIFGGLVHVIGANDVKSENKIRGETCDGAYVDEATLLREPFRDMLLTRMRTPGARIYASTNPDPDGEGQGRLGVRIDIERGGPGVRHAVERGPRLHGERRIRLRHPLGQWPRRLPQRLRLPGSIG
ncbi:terminase large subunit domain-containing protein [Streptomyces sp. NPDC001642]|uniref:terminase large subunit domain-containing protein n=1 Tax=Streptomyces sp. NPDC001642 TaxID=3154392 RepID=UPI003334858E